MSGFIGLGKFLNNIGLWRGEVMALTSVCITVSLSFFQDFDHGGTISQHEEGLELAPGDSFHWECGQFDGLARVVSYQDDILVFKKIY